MGAKAQDVDLATLLSRVADALERLTSPLPSEPAGAGLVRSLRPGMIRVPEPLAMVRTSWAMDPWALGAYSFLPVGARPGMRRTLATPVGERLLFAGEATWSKNPSTVHGALASGHRAARMIQRSARPGESVAVVGAGIAGLACASDLLAAGLDVVVLEARGRIGGRLDTVRPQGWPLPVERGASWVHDTSASRLDTQLERLGVETAPFDWNRLMLVGPDGSAVQDPWAFLALPRRATGAAVRWADRRARDMSLSTALTLSGEAASVDQDALQAYLETEIAAEYGASAGQLSAWWGQEEGTIGPDLLVLGGYVELAEALATGLDIHLGRAVSEVAWGPLGVKLTDLDGGTISADRVVVTVPLGVLQAGIPRFSPALPAGHRAAIDGLGMGLLDKLWLRFEEPFWGDDAAWWTRTAPPGTPWITCVNLLPLTGAPVLLALTGGDTARSWATRGDDEVLDAAMASLEVFVRAGA